MATDTLNVRPNIYCPICQQVLTYGFANATVTQVGHPDLGNSCANIGKLWLPPTIVLTQQ